MSWSTAKQRMIRAQGGGANGVLRGKDVETIRFGCANIIYQITQVKAPSEESSHMRELLEVGLRGRVSGGFYKQSADHAEIPSDPRKGPGYIG